jgi:phosphoserine phosphatase RsbU/P
MRAGAEDPDHNSLNCMEIWGGIEPVETSRSTPGLEFWIYSRPHEGAKEGGDLHYVTLCGGGQVSRIVVADVSGHGTAVAAFASKLRLLLRKNINRKSQRRLVEQLNRQFGEEAKLSRFATAVVATYLTSSDRLSICNAGHPRPLYYRASGGQWSFLSTETVEPHQGAANLPLGVDDETRYDQFTILLERDDLIIFYTDAMIEAMDDQDQVLGEAGLLERARGLDLADLDPRVVGSALKDAVAEFRGERPPDDDLTLVVLHHTATSSPRLTITQKLDVYAKFFWIKSI